MEVASPCGMAPFKHNPVVRVLKETASGWDKDNVSRLAASLAYYTLISIAPLIILAVAVAGLVFGQDAAREHIGTELASVVGSGADTAVKSIATNAHSPGSGVLSVLVGVVVLLLEHPACLESCRRR